MLTDPKVMQLNADWSRWVTPEEFKCNFGFKYEGAGIYKDKADTLLVSDIQVMASKVRGMVNVVCFNRPDAMPSVIASLLSLVTELANMKVIAEKK